MRLYTVATSFRLLPTYPLQARIPLRYFSAATHKMAEPAVNGSKPAEILLIGLGSIGAVYAHILERSGKARVTAVARSNYEAYAKGQVTLDTDRFGKHEGWKPYRVVKSQAEALEGDVSYDYCMITTKCLPDVLPTPKLVEEVIASKKVKAWSLIQNGLGVEEDLYQAVKHLDTPIISSCAWIGIMASQDGKEVTWRGGDYLVSGLYPPLAPVDQPQTRSYSEHELAALNKWYDLMKEGEATITVEDRMDAVRYLKNVWNCCWSSIQGLIRGTPESFVDFDESDLIPLKAFMKEVVDTGFQSGLLRKGMIQYPSMEEVIDCETTTDVAWSKIYDMSVEKAKKGLQPHKMSLLVDIEYGRPFEVEVITGAVLRVAKAKGLQTPNLALMYSLMKGLQVNVIKEQKKKRST